MSARLHWRRHCPGDHLARAADLTLEEDGALLRLMDWEWTNGPLPDDPAKVVKLIRAHKSKTAMVADLLGRFFSLCPAGYVSPQLEDERRHADEVVAKRKEFGRLGGVAKARAKARAKAVANTKQTPSDHTTSHQIRSHQIRSDYDSREGDDHVATSNTHARGVWT